jgi:uncharacterized protein YqeY
MSLKEKITEDMKSAMRAKEAQKLSAIRMLLAAVKQVEVDKRIELTDADVTTIIEKEIKKRRDSITQYTAAKREDLAANEQFEVEVLSVYLPKQADDSEIDAVIAEAIAAAGGAGPQAMGKVMGAVKAKLAGRADMTKVSAAVKAKLAG